MPKSKFLLCTTRSVSNCHADPLATLSAHSFLFNSCTFIQINTLFKLTWFCSSLKTFLRAFKTTGSPNTSVWVNGFCNFLHSDWLMCRPSKCVFGPRAVYVRIRAGVPDVPVRDSNFEQDPTCKTCKPF